MIEGLVVKSISGEYKVVCKDNEYICKPRGIFRLQEQEVKVGDYVKINEKERQIVEVKKRKNNLVRPMIANVDKVFLIFSVKEPDLNLNLLDRIISIIEYNNIEIIIVFTKLDLLIDYDEYNKVKDYYQKIGYRVYESKKDILPVKILDEIKDNLCVFAGQSGVGKSSLLNVIKPDLRLKTDEISFALGRGKHTTRHVELIKICDGYIADTPGFGKIDFDELDLLTLSQTFVEFFENSSKCKYNKCVHIDEPECYIKELVENGEILKTRYQNYTQFISEIKETKKNKY